MRLKTVNLCLRKYDVSVARDEEYRNFRDKMNEESRFKKPRDGYYSIEKRRELNWQTYIVSDQRKTKVSRKVEVNDRKGTHLQPSSS